MNSSVKWDWIFLKFSELFFKKQIQAEQMARWFMALVALVEDPGSTSTIHMVLATISNPCSKDLIYSSSIFQYQPHMWYTYMLAKHSHILKKNNFKKSYL